MNDELLEQFLFDYRMNLSLAEQTDDLDAIQKAADNTKKCIEAYISKHYIKKEDVLEAIGEDEWDDGVDDPDAFYRNKLRASIKSKLNIGDK